MKQKSLARQLSYVSQVIDWREQFLNSRRPAQSFLNLTGQGELDRLKAWTEYYNRTILCVVNNEYALSRLSYTERQLFWQGLWSDFPYAKSVLIYAVLDSQEILPSNLDQWQASERLIRAV